MSKRLPNHPAGPELKIEAFGEATPACEGETVAAALLAAGKSVFSRSVKYHRPRGPYCLAGRCSHCLVRIDGVPNRFACLTPVRDGMRVEAQNVLGAVSTDALGVIDFLFPRGLDHHEMFAGVPVVEKAVQGVARHLAGLGMLPEQVPPAVPKSEAREVDLAIVGAGPAGLALALAATEAGLRVELIDENASPGGRLECGLPGTADLAWAQATADRIAQRGRLSLSTLALGSYRDSKGPFLALRAREPERVTLLHARRFAVCTGGTEPLPLFEGNDLPGVFAARGLLKLIQRHGVLPGSRAVVLAENAEALAVAEALARAGATIAAVVDPSGTLQHASLPVVAGKIERATGRNQVSKVKIALAGKKSRTVAADLVAACVTPAPSFELARQLGLKADFMPDVGFTLQSKSDGSTPLPHVFLAGEITGPMTVDACIRQGQDAARAIVASLQPEVKP